MANEKLEGSRETQREQCSCKTSTGICGTITRGTGRLSFNGYWEFPCLHGHAYSEYASTPAAPETPPDSRAEAVNRLAKFIAQKESRRCKTLDEALYHQSKWERIVPEAQEMLDAAYPNIEADDAPEGGSVTQPEEICCICKQVTNPMFMCDDDPLDVFYCIAHWPLTPCSKGAHGEGCPTSIFTSESPAKLSTNDWLRERLENCERLAKERPENEAGWLEDAEYFRDAIRLIWRSERSGDAAPPVAGTTQENK